MIFTQVLDDVAILSFLKYLYINISHCTCHKIARRCSVSTAELEELRPMHCWCYWNWTELGWPAVASSLQCFEQLRYKLGRLHTLNSWILRYTGKIFPERLAWKLDLKSSQIHKLLSTVVERSVFHVEGILTCKDSGNMVQAYSSSWLAGILSKSSFLVQIPNWLHLKRQIRNCSFMSNNCSFMSNPILVPSWELNSLLHQCLLHFLTRKSC